MLNGFLGGSAGGGGNSTSRSVLMAVIENDLISPHDRRGRALTGDLDLPFDVRVLVPIRGRVAQRRHAVGQRAAPLAPVVQFGRGRFFIGPVDHRCRQQNRSRQGDRSHESESFGVRCFVTDQSCRPVETTYHFPACHARPAGREPDFTADGLVSSLGRRGMRSWAALALGCLLREIVCRCRPFELKWWVSHG